MPMKHQPVEQRRAREAVKRALRSGKLQRPTSCSHCGEAERFGRDGRSLIQAHHHRGYDCQLDVQWLCTQCHRDITPTVYGERQHCAKLTVEKVAELRASPLGTRTIARLMGLNRQTVREIRAGRWWKAPAPPTLSDGKGE